MRSHKDGYLQCRQLTLWVPDTKWREAISVGMYRSQGIEKIIEEYLDVELTGELRFRILEYRDDEVLIQIDDDWVQPTRA